jgi:hypothetical protein
MSFPRLPFSLRETRHKLLIPRQLQYLLVLLIHTVGEEGIAACLGRWPGHL